MELEQKEQDKQLRIARSQRRLARLFARPRCQTRAELRDWLGEFLKIDSTNQPELKARQYRIKQRLMPRADLRKAQRFARLWTQEERMRRRAKATGDAELVIQIAERFHMSVRKLYRSKYGKIVYGRGGEEDGRWSRKYYNTYKHGGVWIDYHEKILWLEDYRQDRKHGFPLPDLRRVTFDGLEDGDLWGIVGSYTSVERYALANSGIVVPVGYASQRLNQPSTTELQN